MITVKDWSPENIDNISMRSVRVAFRKLRRSLPGSPELRRFGIMADHWRDYLRGVIVTNLHRPEISNASAVAVIRQLSLLVLRRCLDAERRTIPRKPR